MLGQHRIILYNLRAEDVRGQKMLENQILDILTDEQKWKITSIVEQVKPRGIGIINTLFPTFRKYRDQKTAKTKSQ